MKITTWLKQNYKFLTLVLLILIIGVAILWQMAQQANQSPKDLASVKANISKLMLLPKDEEPTLAIVENKSELKDKFLLRNAENGDQVLIYTNNGQAIIYRPSINKIVAVRSVTVDAAQAQADGATIQILNGTNDAFIAKELANDVQAKYPTAKVTTGNANRKDFTKTITIDSNDKKDDLFVQLLDLTKSQRGVVPFGEAATTTDILIIIGKDYLNSKRI